jgi:superoxide reductase
MKISEIMKSADWKAEKHVPVITALGPFTPGEALEVEVAVGKEIPHPNTPEHYIAWIALYYTPEGSQLPVEIARAEFAAHGPEVQTAPILKTTVRLPKPGTLQAVAYCNLHGVWESESPVG